MQSKTRNAYSSDVMYTLTLARRVYTVLQSMVGKVCSATRFGMVDDAHTAMVSLRLLQPIDQTTR